VRVILATLVSHAFARLATYSSGQPKPSTLAPRCRSASMASIRRYKLKAITCANIPPKVKVSGARTGASTTCPPKRFDCVHLWLHRGTLHPLYPCASAWPKERTRLWSKGQEAAQRLKHMRWLYSAAAAGYAGPLKTQCPARQLAGHRTGLGVKGDFLPLLALNRPIRLDNPGVVEGVKVRYSFLFS